MLVLVLVVMVVMEQLEDGNTYPRLRDFLSVHELLHSLRGQAEVVEVVVFFGVDPWGFVDRRPLCLLFWLPGFLASWLACFLTLLSS